MVETCWSPFEWPPSGKASALRAAGLGSISAFPMDFFSFRSGHTNDLKMGTSVGTLPGCCGKSHYVLNDHIEGFLPEWRISTIYHA